LFCSRCILLHCFFVQGIMDALVKSSDRFPSSYML
jgi:hypothetical protein